jgi:hypothetical protein
MCQRIPLHRPRPGACGAGSFNTYSRLRRPANCEAVLCSDTLRLYNVYLGSLARPGCCNALHVCLASGNSETHVQSALELNCSCVLHRHPRVPNL